MPCGNRSRRRDGDGSTRRDKIPVEKDRIRTFGVAMEFDNSDALDAYAGNPVHREWERVYERIRVQGTTTLDILGE